MNHYIQGSAARAEEIKEAFKKLGYDTGNLEFTSSLLYYTIEGKVELMCPKSLQNLIKTHPDYKELELSVVPKFKVGDLVLFRDMLGRIKDVPEDEEGPQLYMVGDGIYAEECELRLADHRDEVRILRSPGVC